ncbi:aminoglycoside 3-N-acetyltransferase [Streptomyces sp. TLI_55]|uniref:aminoglycoside N(3)-acetyltransferase n=1 Tax=Streptomyces sp. TLI_55 TaxID=1938861 RepID=UPI000BC78FB3|nr:AAC(3) family N-acetyltransferase [Streptomyces sp. TLI_55]SNX64627.1 aminoglycoside 3-N-acetyltransferase [Streptomyces sp. TLI_55]
MRTAAVLSAHFRELGVEKGTTLLLHSSLRSVGPVRGGGRAVLSALRDALGPGGTLVVPTFTEGNSLTSRAYLHMTRDLTPLQLLSYREHMEPFCAASTPSQGMGRLAEEVRVTPGATRSTHPQASFAVLGPRAARITRDHPLDCLLGERSPLGRLYEEEAYVLLLGVGYETCSAFHLAEYRQPHPPRRRYDCRVLTQDGPRWLNYVDVALDDSDFGTLGRCLEAADPAPDGPVARGRIGAADSRLFPLRWAVDAAGDWLAKCRTRPEDLPVEADRA